MHDNFFVYHERIKIVNILTQILLDSSQEMYISFYRSPPTPFVCAMVFHGRSMEKDGLLPIPIFINGVEAHTVVRDLLTSSYEQQRRREGIIDTPSLSSDCAEVYSVGISL